MNCACNFPEVLVKDVTIKYAPEKLLLKAVAGNIEEKVQISPNSISNRVGLTIPALIITLGEHLKFP